MPECSHCFFRQRDQTLEIDIEMQADVARLEAVLNRKLCSSANFSKVNLLVTSDVSSTFVVNRANMVFGDLTVEKRVQESVSAVREAAKAEVEGELRLKVSEREEQILSMQRQIEELRRKSEQGSQQLQGEVLELELEQALRSRFPTYSIEPVAKGEFGGDVLQKVNTPTGSLAGTILWESRALPLALLCR